MKRILTALTAVLMLALPACGSAPAETRSETAVTAPAAETAEPEAVTVSADEPEAESEPDDEELLAEVKAKLWGTWVCASLDLEQVTFHEDGTGTYAGINDTNLSFTYEVSIFHNAYNNGEAFLDNILAVDFDSGEHEEIIFSFRDEDKTIMIFSNMDHGGYSGVFHYIDWWVKQ